MTKRYFVNYVVIFALLMLLSIHAQSQHDSLYFKTFPNALTVRVYSVKPHTGFTLSSINNASKITYRSNAARNLGAGVTYRNVSANLSAGFGFLNNGIEERGKTTSLDFQLHFFPEKWISDLLFLHYKGFYAPGSYAHQPGEEYYYRPDIQLNFMGLTAYRIQNARRFSYRSAFNQNEWIRKSSGTLLYGGNVYFEKAYSKDSSLIPDEGSHQFSDYSDFHYISFGPGIGYAYTLVIKRHFYLLGSAVVNGNINFSTAENGSIKNRNTSFQPGLNFKTAAGYGGNIWNVSLSYAGNVLWVKQAGVSKANTFPASAVRLTLARQITLKKPVPVVNDVIDKVFGKEGN